MEIPVETLRVETKTTDRVKEVPLEQEVIKEMVEDVYVEKEYVINKIIEKPIFVPKVVTRYIDKYVDVKEFIEVPVFKEVIIEETHDKQIDAVTKVERLRVTGKASMVPMNTTVRGETISAAQVKRFNDSSRQLAQCLEENIRVRAELDHIKGLIDFKNHKKNVVSEQMIQDMRRRLNDLHNSLDGRRAENDNVRKRVEYDPELTTDVRYDSSDMPVLQAQIRSIREHNQDLLRLVNQGKFDDRITNVDRHLVATNVSHPRGSVSSRSYVSGSPSGSYTSRSVSRSVSPEIRYSQPITRVVHGAPIAERAVRRTSPLPVRREVVGVAQPAPISRANQRVVGNPVRIVRATSPVYSGSRTPASSYSSYSGTPSRSLSPLPQQRHIVDSRMQTRAGVAPQYSSRTPIDFNHTFGARSKYQSTIDQVKSKPAGGIYDRQAIGQLSFAAPATGAQDFMSSVNSNSSKYARPSLSTQFPDSIRGNSNKLIGDYSAAYRK